MNKPVVSTAISLLGLLCTGVFTSQSAYAADGPAGETTTAEAAAPPKARVPVRTPKRTLANSGRSPAAQIETEPIMAPGLVRLKDIADVQGVRGNQLVGYGLVTGLEGTGDGQSSTFTPQSLVNMLRKFGLNLSVDQAKSKNIAAVVITADLPAFAKEGSKIDITVTSIGDAKSLQGGQLIRTPLLGADGEVYAVAQGAVSIGGFNYEAGGSKVQKNHVNAGHIPRGAIVETEVPTTLTDGSSIQITLREADFTTASRVAAAIRRQIPGVAAQAMDASTVAIAIPSAKAEDVISFIAQVETVRVTPDAQAKIVINERTGTVVMGGNVRLAAGSIAQGSISIKVVNTPLVVPAPPNSINAPPPVVVPLKDVQVTEKTAQFAPIPATSNVTQLVSALNSLGVTPRDLISILQAMHAVGMIAADIEVQ